MSMDFKVMNKSCDHMLRGISCSISDVDRKTLLPRLDPSVFLISDPVLAGKSELKLYNPSTRSWSRVEKNDSTYGWDLGAYEYIEGVPSIGYVTKAILKYPQKNLQQIFKLSYQASALDCIKCNGAAVVSDLTLLGDPDKALFVINEPKLAQDFLKTLLTPIGSNPYYTWMGTSLVDLPGTKFNVHDVEHAIVSQVSDAAHMLKKLQGQQMTVAAQAVTAREMIESISSIKATQSKSDSRIMVVSIELYTKNKSLTTVHVPLQL